MDHAGLPLKTVLEQLDLLGEEVVPVLRKEFAARGRRTCPEAPTHASLVAAGAADAPPPTTPGRRQVRRMTHARSSSSPPGSASRRRPGCSPTGWPRRPARRCAAAACTATVEVVELRDLANEIAHNWSPASRPALRRRVDAVDRRRRR